MKRILALLIIICVSAGAVQLRAAGNEKGKLPAGFAWGADIGGAIDLSGSDMSTLNVNAAFGYRRGVIDLVGVGTGMNVMVSNSSRMFPVYGIIRSNFRTAPSLCFMDLRAGCAFMNLGDNSNHTGAFVSPGIGFNLAKGRTFSSYLVLSYQYVDVRSKSESGFNIDGLNFACVRLGVSF